MQLRAAGLSQSEIARIHHMSKSSVREVFLIAKERQISYAELKDKSVSECYQLFYPDRNQEEQVYEQPDYAYVQHELARTGVTLKSLWKEHRDGGQLRGKLCNGYSEYVVSQNLTNRLEHKLGTTSQVDWSGSTMQLTTTATGERPKVYLFVATLPYDAGF